MVEYYQAVRIAEEVKAVFVLLLYVVQQCKENTLFHFCGSTFSVESILL